MLDWNWTYKIMLKHLRWYSSPMADFFVNFLVIIDSITKNKAKAQQHLGYCRQSDAFCSLMTVREHLVLFTRIRGVPKNYLSEVSSIMKFGNFKYFKEDF